MDEELNFCPASKWSCHMSCDGIAASCIFYFYPSLFRTHLSVQSSVIIRMSHCWSWTHVNLILVMNPCEMKTRKERGVMQKLRSRCWSLTLPSPLGLSSLWMLFNSHFFSAPTLILTAYQMNRTQILRLFCFCPFPPSLKIGGLCPDGAGSEVSSQHMPHQLVYPGVRRVISPGLERDSQ